MIYLTLPEIIYVAQRTLGSVELRDAGLLESAVARPMASVLGEDAYSTLEAKAAALVHSIARNRALVDGNKRLALACLIAFLGMNGRRLTMTNNEAYDVIMSIASGDRDEIGPLAALIDEKSEPY